MPGENPQQNAFQKSEKETEDRLMWALRDQFPVLERGLIRCLRRSLAG